MRETNAKFLGRNQANMLRSKGWTCWSMVFEKKVNTEWLLIRKMNTEIEMRQDMDYRVSAWKLNDQLVG